MNETTDSETSVGALAEDVANRETVDRGFWRKVRRTAGRIPFSEDAVAAYYCARDSETPGRVRAVLLAALAYFVTPADLIPDFIAVFGFTDDATVLTAAIATISGYIKPRHVTHARLTLEKDIPANDA
ncbi:MAG: DUF1232 domain-containing protein [Sphingomonadales bacterium]|nr:DUF1232 domain-containing protein [Sphingomonadales bacterium]